MQYLTPEEVADRLRVSKWSVYRMVDRGELPSARIGRLVRIPAEALPDPSEAAAEGRRSRCPVRVSPPRRGAKLGWRFRTSSPLRRGVSISAMGVRRRAIGSS